MSNRERIIQIIDGIPDSRLLYVVNILESLRSYVAEEVDAISEQPDQLDLYMIDEAKKINDGTTVSFDEMLLKDGLSYADLQDWISKSRPEIFGKTR